MAKVFTPEEREKIKGQVVELVPLSGRETLRALEAKTGASRYYISTLARELVASGDVYNSGYGLFPSEQARKDWQNARKKLSRTKVKKPVVVDPDLIGKPEELDTSARNAGALTRRREIRDAATLLRLGLAYGPGGMSLREVTAWAQLHDVATLSDVALLKRLRNAADWFGILAAQTLAVRAAVTGCTSGKRLRLVDGTAISAPGGGSAEWRLHMGYDPHTCQFTDFELTDSRDAERLDRFAQTADEIRIADRGFGSRPECIRSLAFGEADYIVRVHWRGLRWLTAEGMRFDMMGFLRGLDCGKNGETTVMIGNSGNKKAGAPFPARLIAVSLPPEKALISKTRLLSENRRKGRVVQAETLEAAGHVLLLTSLPEDEYSAEQVADCYRLRWQIELAFKRLKSLLHLDALRAKEPELAKAWIFANLLAAFLIDDIIQPSLDFPPRSAGSEKKN
ncbi:TPA: IS4 family transposase [Escherichia coli]|nr:IS4 family transposase [Escherichia coli]